MKRIEELVKDLHAATKNLRPEAAPFSSAPAAKPHHAPAPTSTETAAAAASSAIEVQRPLSQQQEQQDGAGAGGGLQAKRAFALIDQVFRGSPAEECGIKEGDKILEFGSLNAETITTDFREIVSLVQNSVGRPIRVRVKRGLDFVSVDLVPHTWSGRGLLGCHLSPLAHSSS